MEPLAVATATAAVAGTACSTGCCLSNLTASQIYELISLVASITTAISLTVKSLYKMRWLNLFGCLGFTIYGVLISAWPLAAVNFYIAIVDALGIVKLKNSDKSTFYFGTIGDIGETYFKHFYSFYEDDIRSFFPDVSYADLEMAKKTYVLFRDMIPVGIFSINTDESGKKAKVIMDYVIPKYRDGQFGSVMYVKKAYVFRDQGIEEFETETKVASHLNYLKSQGFVESEEKREDGYTHLTKKINM